MYRRVAGSNFCVLLQLLLNQLLLRRENVFSVQHFELIEYLFLSELRLFNNIFKFTKHLYFYPLIEKRRKVKIRRKDRRVFRV